MGEWQGPGQSTLCPCFGSQTCRIWFFLTFKNHKSNAAQVRSVVLQKSTPQVQDFSLIWLLFPFWVFGPVKFCCTTVFRNHKSYNLASLKTDKLTWGNVEIWLLLMVVMLTACCCNQPSCEAGSLLREEYFGLKAPCIPLRRAVMVMSGLLST